MEISKKQIFEWRWGEPPPHFAGRADEREEILRAVLERGGAAVVVGRRGVGKTCLLRVVEKTLRERGWVVEPQSWAISRQASAGVPDVVGTLIRAAVTYHRKVTPRDPAPPRMGFVSSSDRSATDQPPTVAPAVDTDAHILGENLLSLWNPEGSIDEFGTLIAENLQDLVVSTGEGEAAGLVVMLDEFQMFGGGKGHRGNPVGLVVRILSECRERKIPCRFILAGMPMSAVFLQECLGGATDLVRRVSLDHLAEGEAREAIIVPLQEPGIRFQPDLVERIIRDTAGHPKLVQFYCQSLLDLCREGEVYTLAQYLEVAGDIEQRYFDEHYSEIEQLPDKRLDALWGIARAVEWKAGEKQISPELACVNPRDIRQFLEMKSSDLQHQIDTLKEPGSEYVYQAARATYGLLRPLLWKRLLRLKGEKAALEAFDYKPMKEMGPENFDDPTKARMWLKEFIAEGTRHSQSIWAYDEYWRESCVKDFLEAADRRADIFLVTRFEEQKLEGRKIRQALQALRDAREGRILLKNYEGPSNVVPIKGRLILIGESIGIHSSQSFAEVGKRECIVNRMSQAQIRNYLEALRKLLPDMEEFKPSASGGHP